MSDVKYTITLEWKPFNVSLPDVEVWMKFNAGVSYCGNSADVALKLHFTDTPSDEILAAIDNYWSGITSESSEATSYISQTDIVAAIAAARADACMKSWDNLSSQQKKLITGVGLTTSDNSQLINDFGE